jgi:hypothetical protein
MRLSEIYEEQARLHEVDAAAITDQIAALRRRGEALFRLAALKRAEAATAEKAHVKARLEHEVNLSHREAEIMGREAATLAAERARTLAQAETARQKIAAARALNAGDAPVDPT